MGNGEQGQELPKKVAKYRNKKVEYGGQKFDSIREFERFQELRLLEKAGKIINLIVQPRYFLRCGEKDVKIRSDRYPNGRHVSYYADFEYEENGEKIVEDVKGKDTPVSRLKRAFIEAQYGVRVRIVR